MVPDANDAVDADEDDDNPLVGVASGAVTFLTLAVAFGLMFLGVPWFWVAFPVGFGGLMPLAIALAKYSESRRDDERDRTVRAASGRDDETDEALAALRDRYARGEIDDVEFEARVERLLETESVDDAETFLGEATTRERSGDRSGERERA